MRTMRKIAEELKFEAARYADPETAVVNKITARELGALADAFLTVHKRHHSARREANRLRKLVGLPSGS